MPAADMDIRAAVIRPLRGVATESIMSGGQLEAIVHVGGSADVRLLTGDVAVVWCALGASQTVGQVAAAASLSEVRTQAALGELAAAGLLETDGVSRRVLMKRAALVGAGAIGASALMTLPAVAASGSYIPKTYSLASDLNTFAAAHPPTNPSSTISTNSASTTGSTSQFTFFTAPSANSTALGTTTAMQYFTSTSDATAGDGTGAYKPRFDDSGTGSDKSDVGPNYTNPDTGASSYGLAGTNLSIFQCDQGSSNQTGAVATFTVPSTVPTGSKLSFYSSTTSATSGLATFQASASTKPTTTHTYFDVFQNGTALSAATYKFAAAATSGSIALSALTVNPGDLISLLLIETQKVAVVVGIDVLILV